MTEFRTKGRGKDRVVYPIRKKPYGVSRELALEEVEALRKKGLRARLIETNKRLDLYAAYEAVTPEKQERAMEAEEVRAEEKHEDVEKTELSRSDADALIDNLNGLKGDWLETGVESRDGKTWIWRFDNAHIMGVYELVDGTTELSTHTSPNITHINLKYEPGRSGTIELSPEQQRYLLSQIREYRHSAVDLAFYAPANSHKVYIALVAPEAGTSGVVLGEPIELMNKEFTHEEVVDMINISYAEKAIRAMRSIDPKLTGRKENFMTVQFSSDYPVQFEGGTTQKLLRALVAPHEDMDIDVSSAIEKALGVN